VTYYRLLENPGSLSGFSQTGDDIPAGTGTLALEVALYTRTNARYILQQQSCTDSGMLSVSGNLVGSIRYVKAAHPDELDYFGYAVIISKSGTTLAIVADNEAVDGNDYAGAVYIRTKSSVTSDWSQTKKLAAPHPMHTLAAASALPGTPSAVVIRLLVAVLRWPPRTVQASITLMQRHHPLLARFIISEKLTPAGTMDKLSKPSTLKTIQIWVHRSACLPMAPHWRSESLARMVPQVALIPRTMDPQRSINQVQFTFTD